MTGFAAFGAPGARFRTNTDGSHLKQPTHNTADDEYPSYSPDGKQIAFNSNRTAFSRSAAC